MPAVWLFACPAGQLDMELCMMDFSLRKYIPPLRLQRPFLSAKDAATDRLTCRYHTQSPESLFAHVPGVRVVMPRSPTQAKGLLLASIFEYNDPVIFMEPKILYRAAVEHVPTEYYTIPLSKADVIKPGKDVTVISYGQPLYLCSAAISQIEKTMKGASIELIDLRTIYPWDRQTVLESVRKTGRAIIVHESMVNYGVGAEVAATIQEGAFLHLEAPVKRVAGWSTHTGLAFEQFVLPDVASKFSRFAKSIFAWSSYTFFPATNEATDLPIFAYRNIRRHQADA